MANPSAVYCEELGYKYKTEKTGIEEKGICVIEENVVEYDAWDFFEGKVGEQYSYCSKQGYDIETVNDGKNQYSREYSVCVIKKSSPSIQSVKERKPVTELMNLNKNSIKKSIKIEGIENTISEPSPEDYGISASSYFDWRNVNGSNWMTLVKDQGGCGSCWAFASVGAIESKIKITKNNSSFDKDLSEQDLVSCFAGNGCNGIDDSQFPSLLSYIQSNGVTDELCFPYSATNEPCSDKCPAWKNRLWYIDGYGGISNVSKTKDYLIEKGPLIALIGMNGYFDSNGIYRCIGTPSLNHAIVIVGYNDTGGYWITKNSWGSGWNSNGYFNVGYNECNIIPSYYIGLPNMVSVAETNYCSVASKSSNYEIIINVSLNGNERNSGKSNYSDFTNTTLTNLTLGSAYTLYVTGNATAQASPNEFVKAWIDFNNDKAFSNDEAIVLGNFTFVGKHTFNKSFTVPNNATVGETKMRVYLKWKSAPTPCENASYGEVEDYKIGILSSPNNATQNNITSCADLNQSGATYYLKNDIINSTNTACMNITASNVVFDCEGNKIDGISTYGIFSQNRINITIKNCFVINWMYGIYLENSSYSTLYNNTANSNHDGIHIEYSNNSALYNNTANSNVKGSSANGIYLSFSNNNTLYNDFANSNYYGIYLSYSNNNMITNNSANSNNYGIFLGSSNSNTIVNNTANSNIYGIWPSSSNKNIIDKNIIISNHNGIYLDSSNNNTISNNSVNSNVNGIYPALSSNNTIVNNTANSNYYGIYMIDSNSNSISNNIMNSNNVVGIQLEYSYNNIISKNIAKLNVFGISPYYSNNNVINENIFCNNTNLDFNIISSTGNSGNNNKCDKPDGWNDNGFVGCKYTCVLVPVLITINSPLNSTVLTESSVWFNLTTNRNSTCNYGIARCVNFNQTGGCSGTSAMNMSTNDGIHHSAFVTSLTNTAANEWYQLGANCTDGVVSNSSYVIFFVNLSTLVNNWAVNLSIDLNSVQKGIWKFGMSDNATDLFDSGTDDTSPPASPEGFDTYFAENEQIPKDRLSIDIKKMADEKNWTLVITAPKQQVVSVKWNSSIDTNLTLKIGEIDSGTGNYIGEILNMKYYDSLTFSGGSNSPVTKFYKITASKSPYKIETLNLNAGWNLISIPLILQNNSVQNVFDNKVQSVWAYENGIWKIWVSGVGGTLTSINPKVGYWVATNENKLIVVEGTENTNHTIPLYDGWSLIGPTKAISLPLSNPYIIGSIWGWTGSNYVSVIDSLEPKKAYWIAVSENTTIEE